MAGAQSLAPDQLQSAIEQAHLDGFHDAYFAGVIFAVIGFAATFLIHDEDAAASMVPAEAGAKGQGQPGERPAMAH
jgi:hypothetical protein